MLTKAIVTSMSTKELCRICGEGRVTKHTIQTEAEYKDVKGQVPLHFLVCDTCTSEFAGNELSLANKNARSAFHKMVDAELTVRPA